MPSLCTYGNNELHGSLKPNIYFAAEFRRIHEASTNIVKIIPIAQITDYFINRSKTKKITLGPILSQFNPVHIPTTYL